MIELALVFRTNAALSPEQLAQRREAVGAWALRLRSEGTIQRSFLLREGGTRIEPERVVPVAAIGEIAAVTIVQATDLEAAIELARSFPGLAYGTTVEVRALEPSPFRPE
jgi:hypothetical protein